MLEAMKWKTRIPTPRRQVSAIKVAAGDTVPSSNC